jgi:DNA polymerase-4
MEPTILHVAIDAFAIQAERLRCPKLIGRPVALTASDSPRPHVLAVSREARVAGVRPGTPLVVARRLCRDLVSLPPDRDLYVGLGDSIRARLAPYAPLADAPGAPAGPYGRFVLDLTGVARTHEATRDRAARAGREVERAFGLHPTLGLAATRLVSGIAAGVLAPDGELLDVRSGSEEAFLAPLPARVLPSARIASSASRLDLLNLRAVRDLQALTTPQLHAAFGALAALLWREARGLATAPLRAVEPPPTTVAEETLAAETNDRRALALRMTRLAIEIGTGLRARGVVAHQLAVRVIYADGREGSARSRLEHGVAAEAELRTEAVALLDRALTRRVRVRRLRLEAWEHAPIATQLTLWCDRGENPEGACKPLRSEGAAQRPEGCSPLSHHPDRSHALEIALARARARFGTETVVPAAWFLHGLTAPAPRRAPRRAHGEPR